jgi:hypothetical protein
LEIWGARNWQPLRPCSRLQATGAHQADDSLHARAWLCTLHPCSLVKSTILATHFLRASSMPFFHHTHLIANAQTPVSESPEIKVQPPYSTLTRQRQSSRHLAILRVRQFVLFSCLLPSLSCSFAVCRHCAPIWARQSCLTISYRARGGGQNHKYQLMMPTLNCTVPHRCLLCSFRDPDTFDAESSRSTLHLDASIS